jgi:hypothetical protein
MYRNPQLTQEQKPTQQLKAEKPIVSEEAVSENIEQTPAQEVKRLRAKEQAELKAAIPNADQYLTDGKVDRAKITDAKDLKKFDEIYDKYDKLITPLLPKSETQAGSVGVGGEVVGKTFRDNYNRTFEVKGENAGILTLEDVDTGKVLRKKKSEVLSDFKEITEPDVVDKAKTITEHLPKGGELKGVTEIDVSENGEEVSYGTKTRKTSITVKGLSAEEIKQEIKFEKQVLERSKRDAANFNEDEIRSAKGMTRQEKEDAIKMHKQSLINNAQVEKIVIPFYEKHLEIAEQSLKETPQAGSVVGGDVEVVPLETVGEDIVYRGIDKRGFGGNGGGVAGLGKGLYTTNSKEEAQKYAWEDGRTKGKPVALKNAKPINSLVLNDGNVQKWIDENLPKSKYKNESDFRDNLSEYVTGLGYDGITIKSSDGVEIYVKYTEQSLKETKAETAPAKPKATKLKAKVDTRLKFKEVSDLSTKINEAVKGSAKRKRLIADRNLLLEKFPIIKYVYENIQNITKQLIQKGIITKDKDKVTYNGVNYSSDEFSSLLHDGLLDQLVKDKIIDDSNFVKKAEAIERTEFDSEEEAELYGISRETDPNVIAAKYFTLPTLEESSSPKDLILMEHFSGKRSSKINESDWAEYNDLNNLTPEIRKKYINSTNKSGRLDTEALSYEENEGISFAPEDFIDFILLKKDLANLKLL